jgi:lipopolysaccharide biosynthesis glycosyltransferase
MRYLIFTIWIKRDPATNRARLLSTKFIPEETFRYNRKAMQNYARRVGADFLVVQDRKYASVMYQHTDGHDLPAYEKFRIADFLADYERVLYVDSDVLITPAARNIFIEFPDPDFFYARNEGHLQQPGYIETLAANGKVTNWARSANGVYRYFNSGVMLASRPQRAMFAQFNAEFATSVFQYDRFIDQGYINVLIQLQQMPVQDLPPTFNYFLEDKERRFDSDFIHYAGPGFLPPSLARHEKMLEFRQMQMIADYYRLYDNRLAVPRIKALFGLLIQRWWLSIVPALTRVWSIVVLKFDYWVHFKAKSTLVSRQRKSRHFIKRVFRWRQPQSLPGVYQSMRADYITRVATLIARFRQQTVPGALFAQPHPVQLPLVDDLKIRPPDLPVDVIAYAKAEVWLVMIKVGPADLTDVQLLRQKTQSYPEAKCWLITMGRKQPDLEGSVLASSLTDIEQLEILLGGMASTVALEHQGK